MKLAGGTVLYQKPNSNSVPAEVGVSSQPSPLPNGDGSAIRAAVAPNHRLLSGAARSIHYISSKWFLIVILFASLSASNFILFAIYLYLLSLLLSFSI